MRKAGQNAGENGQSYPFRGFHLSRFGGKKIPGTNKIQLWGYRPLSKRAAGVGWREPGPALSTVVATASNLLCIRPCFSVPSFVMV
jgi:hypothetical protein